MMMDVVSGADSRAYVNTDNAVVVGDPLLPATRVVGGLTNDTL